MNFNQLFNKVINLPYDQIVGVSFRELDEVREDCERMCSWEYVKDPPHPMFKPYYLDVIPKGCGHKNFFFKEFLHYMFIPWILNSGCDIEITETIYGFEIRKRYKGCDHDFITDIVKQKITLGTEHYPYDSYATIDERIYCKKCGYQQK